MFVYCGTSLTSRAEPDCSYKYYLAVAPLPSRTHSPEIGIKVPRPSRSCIQLWSLGRSSGVEESGDDKGEMHCEMVLCIDSGPALELKWCPLPSHDPVCPESLCYWLLVLWFMR
jgi:transcription factor C subunit 6